MARTDARGVAVVTGGSAGLGRAIVRELADRGWDVAVLARGADGLDGAVSDVRARGRRGLAVSVDVSDGADVERAADSVEQELGEIDLWVNNVMSGSIATFLDTTPEDFERATAVTYFGAVNGTRAALTRMRPRDRGHIIQIGSALAHRGIPLQSAYCGAKHAVHGFTDSVVSELTHEGSAVAVSIVDMPALNTTQFGWVKSNFPHHPQPVPPIYQPEVGARAVADVADKPRRRTWVGNSTVALILGTRVAGRFLDWYLAKNAWEGQFAPDAQASTSSPNLYEPVPGDHGAHGAFDDKARGESLQTWAIRHRTPLYTAAGAAAAAVLAVGGSLLRRR
ncbi:SDR family oxidoreductase [Microbacterium radiodurans]|uniref:SDR family oxidoreductase n=1 Tax=Microbacterium radiodurans TaxID=661398 RepID=A0A5J5IMU3_9MICO|nr:SDR family oxidoreductase [Microbacterium radiodurans]KAA9083779.1 SDR family oxidoreductase [Microbacterium radiodurans]